RDRWRGVNRRNPRVDEVFGGFAAGDDDAQHNADDGGEGEADDKLVEADGDVLAQLTRKRELPELRPDCRDGRHDERPATGFADDFPDDADDGEGDQSAEERLMGAIEVPEG